MKKYILILLVLGVGVATTSYSVSNISFRMMGLGPDLIGIIDDEYSDIYFNPAYITRVDGSKLYTNLSNLQKWGYDRFMASPTQNFPYSNLVGFITDVSEYKGGLIFESMGLSLSGSYETTLDEREALGRYVDSSKTELSAGFSGKSAVLVGGTRLGDYDVGFMFHPNWLGAGLKIVSETKSYVYNTGDTLFGYNRRTGSTELKFKTHLWAFSFGGVTGEPENEWSFCGGITPAGLSIAGYNLYDYFTIPYWPGGANADSSSDQMGLELNADLDLGGTSINLGFRNKRRNHTSSFSLLGRLEYIISPVEASYYDSVYAFMKSAPDILTEGYMVHSVSASGSGHFFTLCGGVGSERYFNTGGLRHISAVGAKLAMILGKANFNVEPFQERQYIFHDEPDTLYDVEATRTYTSGETIKTKGSGFGLVFTVPAGLETYLNKKLVLRLGAHSIIPLYMAGKWKAEFVDEGWKEVIDYERGGVDSTDAEPADELDSRTYMVDFVAKLINLTMYYFGAGYKVSDAIELNFLHFANLTNLGTWRMSVNIRY